MTREESCKLTRNKMAKASTGKEIAEAIITHFRNHAPKAYFTQHSGLDLAEAKLLLESTPLFKK